MSKSRCPKCKRKMLVESEENEQCTSETCTYFVDYGPSDEYEADKLVKCVCVFKEHRSDCLFKDSKPGV